MVVYNWDYAGILLAGSACFLFRSEHVERFSETLFVKLFDVVI